MLEVTLTYRKQLVETPSGESLLTTYIIGAYL